MVDDGVKAFSPIANPYIVGNPIEDRRMFFGREDDFEYLRNKIVGESRGGLIVLCGTRRSGKTSVLFQIRGGRLGSGFVPVLIDMQSITVQGDEGFLDMLRREIVAALRRVGIDGPLPEVADTADNHSARFQAFVDELAEVMGGRKLVLMFDEYELFETNIVKDRFSTDVLNLLANWIEHRSGVFIVFTGSDRLAARSASCWEHFLGKALHRRIAFLSRADTHRLIHEPVQGVVDYAEGVPDAIFRLTAGQPFYTQVICQTLVDRLNEVRSRTVTAGVLAGVVGEIVENPLPQMIFSWGSLAEAEKVCLSVIAELCQDESRSVAPAEILQFLERERVPLRLEVGILQEALERLFHGDLLEKDGTERAYTYKMDLWRQWVGRMHSIWQVVDELGEGSPLRTGRGSRRRGRTRLALLTAGPLLVIGLAVAFLRLLPPRSPAIPPRAIADSTTVTLQSTPPGAMVWLENQPLGRTPISGARVPAGGKVLRAELPGYRPWRSTLSLTPGRPESLGFALEEMHGGLRLASDPPGAQVYIDGQPTGRQTPTTVNGLPAAREHRLEMRLAGYAPADYGNVRVIADSLTLLVHRFVRGVHPLTIVSTPSGAEVRLDGQLVGVTPVNLPQVAEGGHELVLGKAGYGPRSRHVVVPDDGAMIEQALDLLPPGALLLQIEPYADVWIDGRLVAKMAVNKRLELDPGVHQIELRHPVHPAMSTQVEIRSGEETLLKQRLSPGGGAP